MTARTDGRAASEASRGSSSPSVRRGFSSRAAMTLGVGSWRRAASTAGLAAAGDRHLLAHRERREALDEAALRRPADDRVQPHVDPDPDQVGPVEAGNEAQGQDLGRSRVARRLHADLVGREQPLRAEQSVDQDTGQERVPEELARGRRLDLLESVGQQIARAPPRCASLSRRARSSCRPSSIALRPPTPLIRSSPHDTTLDRRIPGPGLHGEPRRRLDRRRRGRSREPRLLPRPRPGAGRRTTKKSGPGASSNSTTPSSRAAASSPPGWSCSGARGCWS